MTTSELYERIRFRGRPRAHREAVVSRDNVRFTVLTPRLLRLEWSETGEFEDRATYAFPTRYQETPPDFTVSEEDGALVLDTGRLCLRYSLGTGRFSSDNLTITFSVRGAPQTWRPGMPPTGNLRGTRRTLDQCRGDASLDPGLISRDGWALFDDTTNVVFGDDGWVAPRPDFELQDWYFFGYGHDYVAALQEYTWFGGEAPLIPRFVLGAWWSRYWAYSEADLRDLVSQFEAHDVPLDVFVIDMDWHTPDSWTGYTWNRDLFPDPPAFLEWLHSKGLRVTLNLHPAEGVQSFEEVYERFAQALGVDPKSGEAVPFRIADKEFVTHYFEMLHHPMEDDGVDFWWMDWQQGEISEVKGLDPLPWINHLHFNDIRRRGVRPMLYSRWGGLGNHRYYIGFSGDTYAAWDALQFQPYMTATAANVLYGWWSHDIGGHMGGATEPELYARWVQFGAVSPVLRLHSTKDPRAERRPWAYPEPVYRASRAAFQWRYRLIPYLYTMARMASDTSVALCRPMYYEDPESEGAYAARYQYYLGDQMIAAPIVFPADPDTGMAHIDVWLPAGSWIAYDTLETFEGPGWVRIVGDLDRIPMLIQSGGVLPLAPDFGPQPEPRLASGTTDALPDDQLVLAVFPGQGALRVYRDDGITEAYREGAFEWLPVRTWQANEGRSWVVTVGPVEGRCDALPAQGYEVRLMGSRPPTSVLVNGLPARWAHDGEARVTTITVPPVAKSDTVTITATCEEGIVALGVDSNRSAVAADVTQLLGDATPEDPLDIGAVMELAASDETEQGVQDAVARLGGPFFHAIEYVTPEEAEQRLGRIVVGAPADGSPMGVTIDFSVNREGDVTEYHLAWDGVSEDLVVDTPFAFEGELAQCAWQARVQLDWGQGTIVGSYRSAALFPTIYRWRAFVYDPDEIDVTPAEVLAALKSHDPAFDFTLFEQDPEEVPNLTEPFALRLWRFYRERLQKDEPIAGYMVATAVSPAHRHVQMEMMGTEDLSLFVNGKPIEILKEATDPELPAFARVPRKSAVFSLAEGSNWLVVHTRAPERGGRFWFLGARLVTPEGDPIQDLAFA
ncbi:MAG: TIM-barrel domain-containing protein [Anaerolineae bacterium]